MAEDIRIEVKVESMWIFIFLGVLLGSGGRGLGRNLKPLMPLAWISARSLLLTEPVQ